MARRRTPMTRRIDPMPMTLTFVSNAVAPGATGVSYIDLSQCASIAGRKFLRQGLNWGIAGIKCSSAATGQVNVYKLPTTWVLANAWKKSFAAWSRMNNEALEETELLRPRFLDFKVYADQEHHALGFAGNLLPRSIASVNPPLAGTTAAGEWESSKIFIPNAVNTAPATTQDFEIIATGGSFQGPGLSGLDALSMVEGYAASRLLPNVLDPNTPSDAEDTVGATPQNWFSAIFNEGNVQSSEVIEELTTENNIAPYPFENDGVNLDTMYPGGGNQMQGLEWHDISEIYSTSATTNVGITRIKGGNFPCGLVKITWTPTESTSNLVFQIDMIPGSHRGYLAESMQDM